MMRFNYCNKREYEMHYSNPIASSGGNMSVDSIVRSHNFRSLDAWRAIAALSVVVYHTGLPGVTEQFPRLGNGLFFDHLRFLAYGVQIFFVISGYCIAQAAVNAIGRSRTTASFITARIRRIYPAYIGASVCAVACSIIAHYAVVRGWIGSSLFDQQRLWAQSPSYYACSAVLMQHICGIKPIMPLFWTLCYEAAFYLIVSAFVFVAIRWRSRTTFLNLANLLTVMCAIVSAIFPDLLPYPLDLWPEFGLGVLAFDMCTQRRANVVVLSCIVISTCAMLMYWYRSVMPPDTHYRAILSEQSLISVIFFFVILLNFFIDKFVTSNWFVGLLCRIGTFSYSIYLSHMIAISVVSQVGKRLHVTQETYPLLMMTQVLVAIPFCFVFFLLAEKPFLTKSTTSISKWPTSTVLRGSS